MQCNAIRRKLKSGYIVLIIYFVEDILRRNKFMMTIQPVLSFLQIALYTLCV